MDDLLQRFAGTDDLLVRFNPNHDDHGRFAGGSGGGGTTYVDSHAASLAEKASKGGFSYQVTTGVEPKGWMISVPGHEEYTSTDAFSGSTITDFAHAHQSELTKDGNYLGAWYDKDNGRISLDVSTAEPDRTKAIGLMDERDQYAIFDTRTGEELTREQAGLGPVKVQRAEQPKRFLRTILDPNKPDESAAALLDAIKAFEAK